MNLIEAIKQRHSVRSYQSKPLPQDLISQLQEKIDELNAVSGLNMQLVVNEKRAFAGINSYGAFHGVENYLVVAGQKSDDLDERAGYYGEMFVLYAQILGLNTCWVGLTYRKQKERYALADDEKIACVITVGYGVTQGHGHKIKRVEQVSNVSDDSPAWFRQGIEAALLAPTAVNQQRFFFELIKARDGGMPKVKARRGFSLVGYTQMDLGIARLHFEIAAGREHFEWED